MPCTATSDVVVVGAGIVGAACAEALSAAGVRVLVIDRGGPRPGPRPPARATCSSPTRSPDPSSSWRSRRAREWPAVLARLPERVADVEWEPKGGLVVATTDPGPLEEFAAKQSAAGVDARVITPAEAFELEPLLTPRGHDRRLLPRRCAAPAGAGGDGSAGRSTGSWWRGAAGRHCLGGTAVRRGRVVGLETDAGVIRVWRGAERVWAVGRGVRCGGGCADPGAAAARDDPRDGAAAGVCAAQGVRRGLRRRGREWRRGAADVDGGRVDAGRDGADRVEP